ncbi:dimethyl sulfoxide reductase [Citrobacter amalonaticus]|uniref:Dimethyl sulfoxide reductase n=1 Tax=Citrobacter amalonaticus TaxID=35703 RepID=A0A2S4RTX0_CITAM|nr:DmsC/YnfH family molybdoenzyme membrane anchor subunit [Citrobacter amalonaticus]POT57133.1 dimethyl sulfoxide reductase [Citrobacter amalonaticus]POT72578.1 dimethyl sulfoxide reductase [Citrobacter amalonaticus]POU63433.1 dimethyl sulfoxide reductase [Citrobacter amalonaticus]POV03197.1 dimethyl sulfoxide reductase [Citrobacter amalonaticus]
MHELPLLIFTLLVQGSVGLTLFMALSSGNRSRLLPPMLIACIMGGLGLVASTLHLGHPLNAFYALRHMESSWLSREIVFASIYLAILGIATLLVLLKKQPSRVLLVIATAFGLIDVFCMGAIYYHSSVITWQHFNTWLMFFGTSGILGAIVMSWLIANRSDTPEMMKLLRTAAVLVVAITVVRLLAQPEYIRYLSLTEMNNIVTLPHQSLEAFRQFSHLRILAWGVSVIGTLLFAIGAWRSCRGGILFGSLGLVVAEVLLRFMFFSIH